MFVMSAKHVHSAGLAVGNGPELVAVGSPVVMYWWYHLSLVEYLLLDAVADPIQVDGDCDGEFRLVARSIDAVVSSLMIREAILIAALYLTQRLRC